MSGTSQQGIFYSDRPMGYAQGSGVFATPEFGQFLERLSHMAKGSPSATADLQTQVDANTASIGTLTSDVATNTANISTALTQTQQAFGRIAALSNRVPYQATVLQSAAIALTSGTAAQIVANTTTVTPGLYILGGTLCLTGSGTVTLASASVSQMPGSIETAPGAFLTGWFGGGASPSTLGADLTVGSIMQTLDVTGTAAYLNARVTFSGVISAYGNLIVWPLGSS